MGPARCRSAPRDAAPEAPTGLRPPLTEISARAAPPLDRRQDLDHRSRSEKSGRQQGNASRPVIQGRRETGGGVRSRRNWISVPLLNLLAQSLPPELVDAIASLAGFIAGAPPVALCFLALVAIVAIAAIAFAPAKKRSQVALRVLALLTRAKHPPGAGS